MTDGEDDKSYGLEVFELAKAPGEFYVEKVNANKYESDNALKRKENKNVNII